MIRVPSALFIVAFATLTHAQNSFTNPQNSVCYEPQAAGPCNSLIQQRWFFNLATQECEQFSYGGCQANDNNFASFAECNSVCSASCTFRSTSADQSLVSTNFGNIRTRNFSECMQTCGKHPFCNAAMFNGTCNLASLLPDTCNQTGTLISIPAVTTNLTGWYSCMSPLCMGNGSNIGPSNSQDDCTFRSFASSQDLLDTIFGTSTVNSLGACVQECAQNTVCNSVMFNGTCYFASMRATTCNVASKNIPLQNLPTSLRGWFSCLSPACSGNASITQNGTIIIIPGATTTALVTVSSVTTRPTNSANNSTASPISNNTRITPGQIVSIVVTTGKPSINGTTLRTTTPPQMENQNDTVAENVTVVANPGTQTGNNPSTNNSNSTSQGSENIDNSTAVGSPTQSNNTSTTKLPVQTNGTSNRGPPGTTPSTTLVTGSETDNETVTSNSTGGDIIIIGTVAQTGISTTTSRVASVTTKTTTSAPSGQTATTKKTSSTASTAVTTNETISGTPDNDTTTSNSTGGGIIIIGTGAQTGISTTTSKVASATTSAPSGQTATTKKTSSTASTAVVSNETVSGTPDNDTTTSNSTGGGIIIIGTGAQTGISTTTSKVASATTSAPSGQTATTKKTSSTASTAVVSNETVSGTPDNDTTTSNGTGGGIIIIGTGAQTGISTTTSRVASATTSAPSGQTATTKKTNSTASTAVVSNETISGTPDNDTTTSNSTGGGIIIIGTGAQTGISTTTSKVASATTSAPSGQITTTKKTSSTVSTAVVSNETVSGTPDNETTSGNNTGGGIIIIGTGAQTGISTTTSRAASATTSAPSGQTATTKKTSSTASTAAANNVTTNPLSGLNEGNETTPDNGTGLGTNLTYTSIAPGNATTGGGVIVIPVPGTTNSGNGTMSTASTSRPLNTTVATTLRNNTAVTTTAGANETTVANATISPSISGNNVTTTTTRNSSLTNGTTSNASPTSTAASIGSATTTTSRTVMNTTATTTTTTTTLQTTTVPASIACNQAMDRGVCRGRIISWYYDAVNQTCQEFVYGGCLGNANRFPDKYTCIQVCYRGTNVENTEPIPTLPEGTVPSQIVRSLVTTCSSTQFQCNTGQCIDLTAWCNSVNECEDGSDETNAACLANKECGYRTAGSDVGPLAKVNWPWMTSVQHVIYGHSCGGALIAPGWVISTAHCYDRALTQSEANITAYEVRFGNRAFSAFNGADELRFPVEKIYIHPNFSSASLNYDLALVHFTVGQAQSELTRQVCLPKVNEIVPRNTKCVLTGWGATDEDSADFPDEVHNVTIPIFSTQVCNDSNHYNGNITNQMLCAGQEGGGQDACYGDAGGPLACPKEAGSTRYAIQGAVSWGTGCARPQRPGVYSRISSMMSFIINTINLGS